MSQIKAIIFDMDGVISDTQKFHALSESRSLEEIGIKLAPEKITNRFSGVSDLEQFETLLNENSIKNIQPADLVAKKWEFMASISNIDAIPGVVAMIHELKNRNLKLAIASSSPLNFIKHVVERISNTLQI